MGYATNHGSQYPWGQRISYDFGGAVVIMYFAIAYEMWPRITGSRCARPTRWQLWPVRWHDDCPIPRHISLMGQPRRVAVRLQRPSPAWAAGHHIGCGGATVGVCHFTDRHSGALSWVKDGRGTAALCPRGKPAQNGPRSLERVRSGTRSRFVLMVFGSGYPIGLPLF
jgi:hypothetical protein